MTKDTNPATPAPAAATPGSNEPGKVTPTVDPKAPATPGQGGNNQEGSVTISTKEYAQLNRDAARLQSFQKRAQISPRGNPTAQRNDDPNYDPTDPANQELEAAQGRAQKAEYELLGERIKNGTTQILDREEFKDLPESTKNVIRKNPLALTDADNLQDALADIEDFVREESAAATKPLVQTPAEGNEPTDQGTETPQGGSGQPQGHDTPPTVDAGNPSPAPDASLEDTKDLSGAPRSRAILRNLVRKKGGVKE